MVDQRRFLPIDRRGVLLDSAVILGAVVRNQIKVSRNREARTLQARQELFDKAQRRILFEMLQPVALTNCQLERFGEANDGGYLMCGNLLGGIQSGYSYGISGYDKWGCDISSSSKCRFTNTTASTRPAGLSGR